MIFFPSNGCVKVAKMYAMQPAPHTSALKSYFSYLIISGAKYNGVPTLEYRANSF